MSASASALAERRHGAKNTEPRKTEGGGLERVTVNLTTRSARALELATRLTDNSKTDAINRAILVYAYLEHIIANGGSIHTKKSDDSVPERLVFF